MQHVTHESVRTLVATSPPGPPSTFVPHQETLGPYECPICYMFKPNMMLVHTSCMRTICGQCLLVSIEGGGRCPFCRGSLGGDTWSETSPTNIIKPPPNDVFWMEKVMWVCTKCTQTMTKEATHSHRSNCSAEDARQPPSHIPPWHSGLETALEVVSNHPTPARPELASKDRLVIVHCNGRQIFSKFFKPSASGRDIAKEISKIANRPPSEVKLYKFFHRALPDSVRVGDVTDARGATHLAAFTQESKLTSFSDKKVSLLLQEVGAPAYLPPPPRRPTGAQSGRVLYDTQQQENQVEEEW